MLQRRTFTITLLAVALATISLGAVSATASGALTTAAAPAATPYCGITWGSLTKSQTATAVSPLVGVRAGRHDCYDRLVLDMRAAANGYRVEYVPEVYHDGSGTLVPLRGGAKLHVVAYAPAYDSDDGSSTYQPADPAELVNVTGFSTFRQIAWAGSFEGQSTIGLGVRARLPFRVFNLDGPGTGSRVVIDVAHRW
jgi:hypothetical protein